MHVARNLVVGTTVQAVQPKLSITSPSSTVHLMPVVNEPQIHVSNSTHGECTVTLPICDIRDESIRIQSVLLQINL